MPTFEEDDDLPPEAIVEGDEHGNPRPPANDAAPAPEPAADRLRARSKRRHAATGRPTNRVNPQARAAQIAAAAPDSPPEDAPLVGASPGGARAKGLTSTEDREVRVWWPRVLKDTIDAGYQASDLRLYVMRVRCRNMPADKPKWLSETLTGDMVAGHENQPPGEALVEKIVQLFHPDAKGEASYQVKALNVVTNSHTVYGTLDLESPQDIEARQRRFEAMRRAEWAAGRGAAPAQTGFYPQSPRAFGPPPAPAPAAASPTIPSPAPVMSMPPTSMPGAPQASMMNDLTFNFLSRAMDEMFRAREEGRAPVMPQMPVPAPTPVDEDARIAKIVAATVTALASAGVIPKPGETPATAVVAHAPQKDALTLFAEREAEQEKFDRLLRGMAKRAGFVHRDELPDAEVPAPTLEKPDDPEPAEGQGIFDFMAQQMMRQIAKDPKIALDAIGKLMNGPFGGFIKDMLAKQGVPLPSMTTSGSAVGPNGFIPAP